MAPGQPCGARPHDRAVVVQRGGNDHAPVGRAEEWRRILVVRGGVTGHDQLRASGGSTRRGCLPCWRGDIGQWGVGQARISLVTGPDGATAFRELRGNADDRTGIGQFQDGSDLRLRQPRRDRLGNSTDLPTGREGDVPVRRIGQCDGHHVPEPHSAGGEIPSQAIRRRLQLAPGQAVPGTGDGNSVGVPLGQCCHAPAVRDEPHGQHSTGGGPGHSLWSGRHPPHRRLDPGTAIETRPRHVDPHAASREGRRTSCTLGPAFGASQSRRRSLTRSHQN